MSDRSNSQLLSVLRMCLQLVEFNEDLGQTGPRLLQLHGALLEAIEELEAAESKSTPAATETPQ
jgi:hypothetical protein